MRDPSRASVVRALPRVHRRWPWASPSVPTVHSSRGSPSSDHSLSRRGDW